MCRSKLSIFIKIYGFLDRSVKLHENSIDQSIFRRKYINRLDFLLVKFWKLFYWKTFGTSKTIFASLQKIFSHTCFLCWIKCWSRYTQNKIGMFILTICRRNFKKKIFISSNKSSFKTIRSFCRNRNWMTLNVYLICIIYFSMSFKKKIFNLKKLE